MKSGHRCSVRRTACAFKGLKTSVLPGTRQHSQGKSGLDFVPERSIALHIASALIDAAPEPRRL
jgi:hypothetical protein